jgi:mono/diheme cytochrome c family protein
MKHGLRFLMIVLAILGIVAAVASRILHGGLSARATPTRLEIFLARNVRHLAIPARARATPNPVRISPENLREARLHFADHCATCHANDGRGSTEIGQGLFPKPPDLRAPETQKLSDGELFWIIENGVRFTGMPAFSSHGEQDDSWELVLFIRHLPQLTPEERMEMERYNPKGPDDRTEEEQEEDFLKGGGAPQKAESEHHHH